VPLPYALAACLLGLKLRDWKAYFESATPTPAVVPAAEPAAVPTDLAVYVGSYAHPADGALQIQRAASGLKGNMLRGYRMAFSAQPLGGHRFAMQFESPEWRALTSAETPVLSFYVEQGCSVRADWVVGPLTHEFVRIV